MAASVNRPPDRGRNNVHTVDPTCSSFTELMSARLNDNGESHDISFDAYQSPQTAQNYNVEFELSQSEQWSDEILKTPNPLTVSNLNTQSGDNIISSQDSYIPSQNTIEIIDRTLHSQPRDIYIEKLSKMSNNESLVTWYRTILFTRASQIEGCPKGKLCHRKTTVNSTSLIKYAKDCFVLNMFMEGDNSEIENVFSKSKTQLNETVNNETLTEINPVENVEMASLVHSLVERISLLEKSMKSRNDTEKKLKNRISELENIVEANFCMFDRFQAEMQPKIDKCEANIKTFDSALENLGEFDYNIYRNQIDQINNNIKKNSSSIVNIRRHLKDAQSIVNKDRSSSDPVINRASVNAVSDQTINTVTAGNETVVNRNINTVCKLTIDEPIVTDSINSNISNELIKDVDSSTQNKSDLPKGKENSREKYQFTYSEIVRTPSVTKTTENMQAFQIPVCVNRKIVSVEPESDCFTAVSRNRVSRYYVTNINMSSTKKGLINYAEQKGVQISEITFFKPRKGRISARLNVRPGYRKLVESDDFWPDGIICRRWYNKREWSQWLQGQNENQYDEHSYND